MRVTRLGARSPDRSERGGRAWPRPAASGAHQLAEPCQAARRRLQPAREARQAGWGVSWSWGLGPRLRLMQLGAGRKVKPAGPWLG